MRPSLVSKLRLFCIGFASKTGNDTTYTADAYNTFADRESVSNYAQEPVKWATSKKIINGDNGNIKPKKTATRAEVAQMLMNSQNVLVKTTIIGAASHREPAECA